MPIANSEKVLMVSLAQIRRKNKVILVLFIDVVSRVPLPCRVCESCNDIALYQLDRARCFVFLQFEGVGLGVLDSVVVVYSLLEQ